MGSWFVCSTPISWHHRYWNHISRRRSSSRIATFGDYSSDSMHVVEAQPKGPIQRMYMCQFGASQFQLHLPMRIFQSFISTHVHRCFLFFTPWSGLNNNNVGCGRLFEMVRRCYKLARCRICCIYLHIFNGIFGRLIIIYTQWLLSLVCMWDLFLVHALSILLKECTDWICCLCQWTYSRYETTTSLHSSDVFDYCLLYANILYFVSTNRTLPNGIGCYYY